MLNQFYLHFRKPQPLERVRSALTSLDPNADVSPIFDGSFACALDASPSAFRYAVDRAFPESGHMYCQVKNNSLFVIPGKDRPETDSENPPA